MEAKPYSALNRLVQRIASSAAGSWLFARVLHHLDRLVLSWSGGRATLTSYLSGAPVVLLTTTGARSGLPRTVPLLCIRDRLQPERFALIASNWGQRRHPAWYYNLKANPRSHASIDGRAADYLAREAGGEEYERFWNYAQETYFGFPLYKQRAGERRIPIMVLTPQAD